LPVLFKNVFSTPDKTPLMDLLHYFDPIDFEKVECPEWANKKHTLGYLLQKNQEKLKPEKADLLIIGVPEDRNSVVSGSAKAPDEIRKHLYSLNRIGSRFKIYDLGNLKRYVIFASKFLTTIKLWLCLVAVRISHLE